MDFLITEVALLIVTVAASAIFYQRIKGAQEEYEKSKEVTKNIAVSFSRALSKEEKRIDAVSEATKTAAEKSAEALRISEESRSEIKDLSNKVDKVDQELESVKSRVEELAQRKEPKEERRVERGEVPMRAEPAPPVTRRGESSLSKLNSTEFTVLEILDREGEMTVPRIRERIGKTREHTARLLKKLYDNGFIDRVTGSMPYKYKIRKELKDLIAEQKEVDVAS